MSTSISQASILSAYITASQKGRPYTWFNYQPINLPGYETTLPLAGRNCFDRLEAIALKVDERFRGARIRIIDWGCNLGFFAFELASRGHDVVGIDADRHTIDVCRYLAANTGLVNPPKFFCDKLDFNSIELYGGFDVAICLSVLHHLRRERASVLDRFSKVYPQAFIEMDGRDFGRHELGSYFWQLEEVARSRDRYGTGTRVRKTFFCNNVSENHCYTNIKQRNIVGGRGVFLRRSKETTTVVKRESLRSNHTWIRTNLTHELQMYQTWANCPFFVDLIDSGDDKQYRWIECQFIENDESVSRAAIHDFFKFLEENRLFILDLCSDSFLFDSGQLYFVDLESLFPIETTIADLVQSRTTRDSIRLDTYQKQIAYLEGHLGL